MENNNTKLSLLSDYIDRLKCEKRRIWRGDGNQESVADHSWGLSLLLMYCLPHLKIKLDVVKLFKLATIHDLPEAISGDVPFLDVFNDPELKKKKFFGEKEAVSRMEQQFRGHFGEELADLWEEYHQGSSNESRIVKALDKIEAQLQQLNTDCMHWGPPSFIAYVHETLKKYCECDPYLAQLAEEICYTADEKLAANQTVS